MAKKKATMRVLLHAPARRFSNLKLSFILPLLFIVVFLGVSFHGYVANFGWYNRYPLRVNEGGERRDENGGKRGVFLATTANLKTSENLTSNSTRGPARPNIGVEFLSAHEHSSSTSSSFALHGAVSLKKSNLNDSTQTEEEWDYDGEALTNIELNNSNYKGDFAYPDSETEGDFAYPDSETEKLEEEETQSAHMDQVKDLTQLQVVNRKAVEIIQKPKNRSSDTPSMAVNPLNPTQPLVTSYSKVTSLSNTENPLPALSSIPTTSTSLTIPLVHFQRNSFLPAANLQRLVQDLAQSSNQSHPQCNLTLSSPYKSWVKGMVTQMGKPINRSCSQLMSNSHSEIDKVQTQVKEWRKGYPWQHFALKFRDSCQEIRNEFLDNFYNSQAEIDFPLAYILVVYTNAGQVIRLLKSIYRPQNIYCIHPDAKQGNEFSGLFRSISACLDNVFVVSHQLSVYYAHHSIMDAQLNCMTDLQNRFAHKWKYVINLCGREIPLMTNREIIQSLMKLKGYTALQNFDITPYWWERRFTFKFNLSENGEMLKTEDKQGEPPLGIKIYKSMNFIAFSYAFVEFILTDRQALELHNYLKSVYVPEEHFYSSLYELSYARGAKPKKEEVGNIPLPAVDRFIWIHYYDEEDYSFYYCPGKKVVHSVCIVTTPDLQRIYEVGIQTSKPYYFFNKYFLEWDPTPMDCMEERLVYNNIKEYAKDCTSVSV